jgi:hypothetical protein
VSCTNIGFHDINDHSSEIYDGTDWAASVTPCEVGWATQLYDANPNANALRWATLYNFRFDADAPPGMVNARLALFRPGSPDQVTFTLPGPVLPCGTLDRDADGDVDSDDFGRFQRCLSGAGHAHAVGCDFADLDHDSDGDALDFTLFTRCSNGPAVPYPTCGE